MKRRFEIMPETAGDPTTVNIENRFATLIEPTIACATREARHAA
jgi:hypothetical protein